MAVIGQSNRILGIGFCPHFAAQALRTTDRRHQDGVLQFAHKSGSSFRNCVGS